MNIILSTGQNTDFKFSTEPENTDVLNKGGIFGIKHYLLAGNTLKLLVPEIKTYQLFSWHDRKHFVVSISWNSIKQIPELPFLLNTFIAYVVREAQTSLGSVPRIDISSNSRETPDIDPQKYIQWINYLYNDTVPALPTDEFLCMTYPKSRDKSANKSQSLKEDFFMRRAISLGMSYRDFQSRVNWFSMDVKKFDFGDPDQSALWWDGKKKLSDDAIDKLKLIKDVYIRELKKSETPDEREYRKYISDVIAVSEAFPSVYFFKDFIDESFMSPNVQYLALWKTIHYVSMVKADSLILRLCIAVCENTLLKKEIFDL